MEEWDEIGRRIERQRTSLRLGQHEAAALAGVSTGTWLALEKGKRPTAKAATLRHVCEAMKWPANQIAVWRGEEAELEPSPITGPEPTLTDVVALIEQVLDRIEHYFATFTQLEREVLDLRVAEERSTRTAAVHNSAAACKASSRPRARVSRTCKVRRSSGAGKVWATGSGLLFGMVAPGRTGVRVPAQSNHRGVSGTSFLPAVYSRCNGCSSQLAPGSGGNKGGRWRA